MVSGAGPVTGSGSRTDQRRLLVAVLAGSAAVIVALAVMSSDWTPTTDWAMVELQVRRINTLPLIGSPSTDGFNHPGPFHFYALAPLYHLLGRTPSALILSTAAVSAAWVAAIGWLAFRRGGLRLTLVVLAATFWLAGSASAAILRDPWNPWMALLPFACFLLAGWSVLDQDRWALPILVLSGTAAAQAHVAYVPLVAVAFVAVIVALVLRRQQRPDPPRPWRPVVIVSVVIGIVLWAPPLINQVTAGEGNVTAGIDYFSSTPEFDRVSTADALGLIATEVKAGGPWLTADEPVDGLGGFVMTSSLWWLLVVAVPIGLLVLVARRRTTSVSFRTALIPFATAGAAALVAIARLERVRAFPYIVRFTWVLMAAGGVAIVMVLLNQLRARGVKARALDLAAAGLLLVSLGRLVTLDLSGDSVPVYQPDDHQREVDCLDQILEPTMTEIDGKPTFLLSGELWPIMTATVANELHRAGVPIRVDERLGGIIALPDGEARPEEVRLIIADEANREAWMAFDDTTVVAECDLLDPEERAEADRITRLEDPTPLDIASALDLGKRSGRVTVIRFT